MKLYMARRYDRHGMLIWERFSRTRHSYNSAKGNIDSFLCYNDDRVTLYEIDVPDENITLIDEHAGAGGE